jgi:FAD/FMN-containing dehydrogenase
MDAALRARIRALIPDAAIVEGDALAERTVDWTRKRPLTAAMLVRPANTAELSAVMRACHEAAQPVVVHGGLTGLVHGTDARPGDLVVSLERMRRIESVDPVQRVAIAQAGATLQQMQEAADAQGLLFPLDLGGRGSATLGGNTSTNAGGNRVLRFGMMRDMILGIEAVLADGTVLSSMNALIKNNSGYDLKQLFVGTEGTLGIVTRLVLRLREKPARQDVAFVAVASFDALVALLKHMDRALGGTMSAFEVMWPAFYELVTTPPAKGRAPVPHGHPFYVLIESMGGDAPGEDARFEGALESALAQGLVADAAIAQSQAEVAAIWALRDDVMQTGRWGAPWSFDVSMPIARMPRYVEQVGERIRGQWPAARFWVFGHLGDGNLHVVVSSEGIGSAQRERLDRCIYEPLAGTDGAVSAEHGIGFEKKPWLPLSRTPTEIALMRTLKAALDPRGILNPGRIF